MNYWIRLMTLVVVGNVYSLTSGEEIALSPLSDIVWPVSYNVAPGVVVDTAIALKAQGKRLEVNYSAVAVEETSVYESPLDVCAAAIRALVGLNEGWWGGLCAPWSERDSAGLPHSGYRADSAENMYRWYTYFTVNPQFGQITDAAILTYVRVGELHAFDVAWVRTTDGVAGAPTHAIVAVEEGPSGRFRLAPEWMRFDNPISSYLSRTTEESKTLRDYRNAVPSQRHEIVVDGLYGGSAGVYPLTLLFRGSIPSQSSKYTLLQTFVTEYGKHTAAVPSDTAAFPDSTARDGLADLLTAEGLEILDEADTYARAYNPFNSELGFVMDGGPLMLVYVRATDTRELVEGFRELVDDEGKLKLANFLTATPLQAFLSSEKVWPRLSAKIDEIAGKSK